MKTKMTLIPALVCVLLMMSTSTAPSVALFNPSISIQHKTEGATFWVDPPPTRKTLCSRDSLEFTLHSRFGGMAEIFLDFQKKRHFLDQVVVDKGLERHVKIPLSQVPKGMAFELQFFHHFDTVALGVVLTRIQ